MVPVGKGQPVFIAYTDNGGNIAPNLFIATPAGGITGDIVVSFYGARGTAVTWTPPSGTEYLDQGAIPSLGVTIGTASGIWTASSGAATNLAGVSMLWRIASYDAVGSVQTITGNGTLTIPAITSAGGTVLALIISEDISTAATTPTGFTSIYNSTVTGQRINISYKKFFAGTTGTVDSTITGATNVTGGVLLGLK